MPQHPQIRVSHVLWFAAFVVAVIALGIVAGLTIARGNSDYVCMQSSTEGGGSQSGACTEGSWSPWTQVNGTYQRTYTGVIGTVTYSGTVRTGYVSCSHPSMGDARSVETSGGTVTTVFSACQIVQTAAGAPNPNSVVSVTSQTQTNGAVISQNTVSGDSNTYQSMVDALLATSSLSVKPALVRANQTTKVIWSSDHVSTCSVTATNGDTWTALRSPAAGEVSKPITEQTTYTLTCTTGLGRTQVSHATVDIIPSFQEQ